MVRDRAKLDRRSRGGKGMPSSHRHAHRANRLNEVWSKYASEESADEDEDEEAIEKEESVIAHVLDLLDKAAKRVVEYRGASRSPQIRSQLIRIAQRIDRVADTIERHQVTKERGRR